MLLCAADNSKAFALSLRVYVGINIETEDLQQKRKIGSLNGQGSLVGQRSLIWLTSPVRKCVQNHESCCKKFKYMYNQDGQ